MKNFLVLTVIVLFTNVFTSSAQDTTHTLVKLVRPNYLGLYVAPEYQIGQLNGAFTSIGGASAMLLINKKLGVGVTASRSLNESFSPKGVAPLYLSAQFGGIRLEYTPRPNAAVHVTFPLVVGVGSAQTDSVLNFRSRHDEMFGYNRRNRYEQLVVQPGIQLEANLIRFAKLFAGVNYRLAFKSGSSTTTLPNNTLSGVSINMGLKLGLFDYWIGKKQNLN